MRLTVLGAGAALVAGLALSACSSSSPSSTAQSPGTQVLTTHRGHPLRIRPVAGVKVLASPACGSQYNFCIYVTPGNTGPYLETSDGTAPLYNVATIVKAKSGKTAKTFSNYFSPDPGDPTYQYITYTGKTPKKPGKVKFDDVYCIGFSSTECANGSGTVLHFGIAVY